MLLLLDSTVLIDALRHRGNSRSQFTELVLSGHTLTTSAINIGEVYAGMRPEEELKTRSFLSALECHPVTEVIARNAGALKREFAGNGRNLSLADMMFAATALEHKAALKTDNRKDLPIPDLKFYP